jgi:hypothetical protein
MRSQSCGRLERHVDAQQFAHRVARAATIATIAVTVASSRPSRAQGSDDCATPQAISGVGSFAVDNTAATTSPPPASTSCAPLARNVWFRWQAPPSGGIVTLSSCGHTSAPMKITVYEYQGAGCPTGTPAAFCLGQCWLSWIAQPNLFYVIEMGSSGGGGSGEFGIGVSPPSSGTSFCDPGMNGVIACPCANPPSTAQRGCDNSSTTGGASLSATGWASLTHDSLSFTCADEKPTATSILLQGTGGTPSVQFGQGVRCVGGTLLRLYVKTAAAGAVTFPGAGDPTISARCAEIGSPIAATNMRAYAVYYRDATVLGGCGAENTFNVSQSMATTWTF